jgi:hypothetical protein
VRHHLSVNATWSVKMEDDHRGRVRRKTAIYLSLLSELFAVLACAIRMRRMSVGGRGRGPAVQEVLLAPASPPAQRRSAVVLLAFGAVSNRAQSPRRRVIVLSRSRPPACLSLKCQAAGSGGSRRQGRLESDALRHRAAYSSCCPRSGAPPGESG